MPRARSLIKIIFKLQHDVTYKIFPGDIFEHKVLEDKWKMRLYGVLADDHGWSIKNGLNTKTFSGKKLHSLHFMIRNWSLPYTDLQRYFSSPIVIDYGDNSTPPLMLNVSAVAGTSYGSYSDLIITCNGYEI